MKSNISNKYSDIINLQYPLQNHDDMKHPRMSIEDRAKIFAPFAALTGYENAIKAKQKIIVPRIELSDELRDYLDIQLKEIENQLIQGYHPIVTAVYFQKDRECEDGGEYIRFTGMAAKIVPSSGTIQIVDRKLRFDDIYELSLQDV